MYNSTDDDLRQENAQLRALLGAALQDAERLDWLENNSADAYEVHGAWHIYPDKGLASPGLRLAIDKARQS